MNGQTCKVIISDKEVSGELMGIYQYSDTVAGRTVAYPVGVVKFGDMFKSYPLEQITLVNEERYPYPGYPSDEELNAFKEVSTILGDTLRNHPAYQQFVKGMEEEHAEKQLNKMREAAKQEDLNAGNLRGGKQ